MNTPRPEYPRPQMVRADWLNLNGPWQFEIDPSDSGLDRGLLHRDLTDEIVVPFCPESQLSGLAHTDFMLAVWYRKTVRIPDAWRGQRILLHIGACDYDTTIWVDGVELKRHRGGFTPICVDLADLATGGEDVTITIRARDDWRGPKPRGKQSQRFGNHGCHYTRTTGIWQTVWMEPVGDSYLLRPKLTPDRANALIRLEQRIMRRGRSAAGDAPSPAGQQLRVRLHDGHGDICKLTVPADEDLAVRVDLPIPKRHVRLWSPEDPHLYDVDIELVDADGDVLDRIRSYAGLRSVTLDGKAVLLNGEPLFQRLVLDQGYWPDGLMTAPSDEALIRDIRLSLDAGFNGARLHQKIFEERFLYHADRMGYLCWGEFPDWGSGGHGQETVTTHPTAGYITQWLEILERDYSHPSIVGWVGLNESVEWPSDQISELWDVTNAMFLAAKAMDTTRPVLDASGYTHFVVESDIIDAHDYTQDPAKFAENYAKLALGEAYVGTGPGGKTLAGVPYAGQPFFVSEFGGIRWNPKAKPGECSWGYGTDPKTLADYFERFEGLCTTLLEHPQIFGYCYTQLVDTFQEQNGLYNFDRTPKFDIAKIRAVQDRPAAIEQLHVSKSAAAQTVPAISDDSGPFLSADLVVPLPPSRLPLNSPAPDAAK